MKMKMSARQHHCCKIFKSNLQIHTFPCQKLKNRLPRVLKPQFAENFKSFFWLQKCLSFQQPWLSNLGGKSAKIQILNSNSLQDSLLTYQNFPAFRFDFFALLRMYQLYVNGPRSRSLKLSNVVRADNIYIIRYRPRKKNREIR